MSAPYGVQVVYGALPKAIMESSPEIVYDVQRKAIAAAMPFLQRQLALATPSGATGIARSSVTMELYTPLRQPLGFVGYGGAASLYMGFVEYGTKAHWPPWSDPTQGIGYYAARKFGYPVGSPEARRIAYLIARKISRVGTRAQHVVENTTNENRAQAVDIMRRAALEAFASIGR